MTYSSEDSTNFNTDFLPAGRSSDQVVERQSKIISELPGHIIASSTPIGVMVLNFDRQIVMANPIANNLANAEHSHEILGKRPGEALGCIHSLEAENGCGTSKFCRYCGAAQALQFALSGDQGFRECRIQRFDGSKEEALDFLCWSIPYELHGEYFIIFSLMDIAHKKRRRNLERIFFHDILNTSGALSGFLDLIKDEVPSQFRETIDFLYRQSEHLIEEIREQKLLLEAEDSELKVNFESMNSKTILEWTVQKMQHHEQAKDKNICLSDESQDVTFNTDPVLLSRILTNMCKNALEASRVDQIVTLGCFLKEGEICFWVHNVEYMPEEVQMQIFKRSFSTKGSDRGLGTYSMKLLSERYLKGRVDFDSSPEKGTIFWACYPK